MWWCGIGLCVSDSSFAVPNIGEEGLKGELYNLVQHEQVDFGPTLVQFVQHEQVIPNLILDLAPVEQACHLVWTHPPIFSNDRAICPDQLWKC